MKPKLAKRPHYPPKNYNVKIKPSNDLQINLQTILLAIAKSETNIMKRLDDIQREIDNLKSQRKPDEKPLPTIQQQLDAIDRLSNSLSDEEKEVFGKYMDEMEYRYDA